MPSINPPGWPQPKGYSNGVAAEGRMVFVAGQIGWTPEGEFETDDFAGQVRQTLLNTVAVLEAGGAKPEHITRMTWYVTDKQEYLGALKEIGAVYREVLGKVFPAMALVQVVALVEDRAKVEIETTAVIPNG
ncbi:RidA family protein [Aestuariispira ectoiniformans]|uniref:RidA family protein n=1 Tax=Aestuariispira ectoiniformans TaxID=2775080 RepID=UPI00223C1C4A|nr:RidA family protein [Aestuariispira ectoiniformans]